MSKVRANEIETTDSSRTILVGDIATQGDLENALSVRTLDSIAELSSLDTEALSEGFLVNLSSYISGESIGSGGHLFWSPDTPKSDHNGITVFSPTVPFNDSRAALGAYRSGSGELDPLGSGVFVRDTSDGVLHFNWCGGFPDESAIDQSLQACIDIAQDNELWIKMPRRGVYVLSTGVEWKHGDNGSDPLRYPVLFDGNDCIFRASDNTTSMRIVGRGAFETGDEVAMLHMRRFILDGNSASTGHIGLDITANQGAHVNGFGLNSIQDVLFESYQDHIAYSLESTRHIEFQRVSAQGPVRIVSTADSQFSGDCWWLNCEFSYSGSVGSDDQGALLVKAGGSEIRGLHFTDCVTYGWGTYFIAEGQGSIGDIWMTSCAWDGPGAVSGDIPIFFDQRGSSSNIFGIHITAPYINNYRDRCLVMAAATPSNIRDVGITDPQVTGISLENATSAPVVMQIMGVHGFALMGGNFASVSSGDVSGSAVATFLDGCLSCRVVNVSLRTSGGSSGIRSLVTYDNSSVEGIIVCHNVAEITTQDLVDPYGAGSPSVLIDRNLVL